MRRALLALTAATALLAAATAARADTAIGPRVGIGTDPDETFLGGQIEFPHVVGRASLVPGLDLGLGDANVQVADLELRWYLLPLPETGLRFYGGVGPTLVTSPDEELGLSLTAGLAIPMRADRRYNVECRFGSGDVPEFKVALAVMFGF